MKSKKASEYVRAHQSIIYASDFGLTSDTLNTSEAIEAIGLAEEELEAVHRARRNQWMQVLKVIRGLLARDDADTARIVVNNLLIEMKDREDI